jgi:hypothetical protein
VNDLFSIATNDVELSAFPGLRKGSIIPQTCWVRHATRDFSVRCSISLFCRFM